MPSIPTSGLVRSFSDHSYTSIEDVGGKALSLIRMTEGGFPVPPGEVLTTAFFAPWFDEVAASVTWRELIGSPLERWADLCESLKGQAHALRFTSAQKQALHGLQNSASKGALFAVRSSAPEEDLVSASFAGGYKTVLGVPREGLEKAVHRCFLSSLDVRVLVYKREHGLDPFAPSIAVIVQEQINSDIAGVGFSLNPLTNDYDEAVIDANWGLGESVVSGLVTPDHIVVNKVTGDVVEKHIGAKHLSFWLDPDGGLEERRGHRSEEFTLTQDQIAEVARITVEIEAFYGRPTDIEWAYSDEKLYALQARPITTFVPLSPDMTTEPGERRRLYVDAALSKGMTTNAPISVMEMASMNGMLRSFLEGVLGIEVAVEKGLVFGAGHRLYMNLSNVLRFTTPEKLAQKMTPQDLLMGRIMAGVDADQYRALTRPPWLRLRLLLATPGLLWTIGPIVWDTVWPVLAPDRAHRTYLKRTAAYERALGPDIDYSLSLSAFRVKYGALMVRQLFKTMPAFGASLVALLLVDWATKRLPAEDRRLAEKLKTGFPDNVVVDMGIAMQRMAQILEPSDFEDLDKLATRIAKRTAPAQFLGSWDDFMERFGARGPLEMDVASPRYGDRSQLALRQMSFMTSDDERFSPEAGHGRLLRERRAAYEELQQRTGWLRKRVLKRAYRLSERFAGTRDTPKHHMVMFSYVLRKRALALGQGFVDAGRLDAQEHIFDFTFDDLDSAKQDTALDLRAVRKERTAFLRVLEAHISDFPQVIDSRGRILRPSKEEETPGEMRGMGVSAGVVTGPVKVLRTPHEKSVEKGDVLVAYTTDPGWTPLFINAAAVILEVGGMLQHGAVVAREYGKPCVTGIDRATKRLEDGQMVEVDGAAGIVRLL